MIIDRIEGKNAVVEIKPGKYVNVPIELFAGAIKEGDKFDLVFLKPKPASKIPFSK